MMFVVENNLSTMRIPDARGLRQELHCGIFVSYSLLRLNSYKSESKERLA